MRSFQHPHRVAKPAMVLAAFSVLSMLWALSPPEPQANSATLLNYIVERMQTAQHQREQVLLAYQTEQTSYIKSGTQVRAMLRGVFSYRAPDSMQFRAIQESGSSMLRHRVLIPIVDRELENARPDFRRKTGLSPDNYEFSLISDNTQSPCHCYVLGIEPRRKEGDLLRGKIWVDASDFQVRHMEGTPAKRPSFWVRSIQITRDYSRVGQLWMPTYTHTENQVLLFGMTVVDLRCQYDNVQVAPTSTLAQVQQR